MLTEISTCSLAAMSNIPGLENVTGLTRAEINSVIMNYLVTGTLLEPVRQSLVSA